MSNDTISYLENGHEFTVHFDELLKYHGAGYPGGVVHGLKVMQRAWPLLDNGRLPERREIRCVTAFGGPGGRDAIEFVTRGLTEGRYIVDNSVGLEEEESPVVVITSVSSTVAPLLKSPSVPDTYAPSSFS